jgi:hypothetical protein
MFGWSYRIFDVGGILAIAGISLMLVVSTVFNTVRLYRAETPRYQDSCKRWWSD